MKFSVAWLREWLSLPLDTACLAEQLTMAGLEVESLVPVAPPLPDVVVGMVQSATLHPNADRLRVCQVDTGAGEARTIVCGASNVRAGLKVAVALPGAQLPGDLRIRATTLRGVRSEGMICSATELQLGEDGSGIIELATDAPVGMSLTRYLTLDDEVIELKLTPNRGDCLGMLGIAREVAALNDCAINLPAIAPVPATIDDYCSIDLDHAGCPRYAGRVLRGVNACAETPAWLRERLRRAGMRSINPIVDVTNYVMLELGQPMHAFDRSCLSGGLHVRCARADERLQLLDGREIKLRERSLVIADQTGPLALAGIMGGAASGVTSETSEIVLESAFFEPRHLAEEARWFRLHTDASHRFERGVDYLGQERALERATALILEICGGSPGPVVLAAVPNALPRREPITLRDARVARILGIAISADETSSILDRLGMAPVRIESGWVATAPSYRFDIEREIDLIEELARVSGYQRIPESVLVSSMPVGLIPAPLAAAERASATLADRGYHEAITYSFISEEALRRVAPEPTFIKLSNPISSEMGVMRTSLWPGLLKAAAHNMARQQERVRLFECGATYRRDHGALIEQTVVAGVACGLTVPEQWGAPRQMVDYFDVKADVEAVLQDDAAIEYLARDLQWALHPNVASTIVRAGRSVGSVGRLHPRLEQEFGFDQPIYLFELALSGLVADVAQTFRPISRYPSVRRDLSLVLDAEVPARKVLEIIRIAGTDLLQDLQLFDEYHGQTIESKKKSIAIGLIFQASSSTLKDETVDQLVEDVVRRLHREVGATLRES